MCEKGPHGGSSSSAMSTYEGWIVVDGTRDTAVRNARKAIAALEPNELRQRVTHGIQKKVVTGKVARETRVRAASDKMSRAIELPYT
jgi:hypothetical protein